MYECGSDYDAGDLVQFTDEYGNEGIVRIKELIIAQHDTCI